jgi:NAD(P)-dependent dehydrogenase (short-subunit alcohol dehydrogenase family)
MHDAADGRPTFPTVFVTGCSSGFGALMSRTLAAAGHHVFAGMRDVAATNAGPARQLKSWAEAQGVRLDVIDVDVTDQASVDAAVRTMLDKAGRVDVAVNNAGRAARGPMEAFSDTQVQALFDVNVFGPMRVNKAVLPAMRAQRSGLIVHVSSTVGRVLPGFGSIYAATKWALEGVAESLHYEVRTFGIDVAILEPGVFATPVMSKVMVPEDAAVGEAYAAAAASVTPPMNRAAPWTQQLPDPQGMAAALKQVIELPAGQRPLRTVVGSIFTHGVAEYNEAYELASRRLIESLQRGD